MNKVIIIASFFLIGILMGYLIFSIQNPSFEKLSPEGMYQRIIEQRDYAIDQAIEAEVFRCCIDPPCTMCYMEANQWNNHTPGTCACDDLIAQDIEPCPQCKKGPCDDSDTTCSLKESVIR